MKASPALALIAVITTSEPGFAAEFSDAIDAMRAGDFAVAYCILKPYADRGDADAQYNIGWMYLNGYGLAMNDHTALKWWERASEQGHTDAKFSIAMLYSLGEGQVRKDMDKAIDYYLMAVQDGHEDAKMILRSMLSRDDTSIRQSRADIIMNYGFLLGPLYDVRVARANLRSGPSLEDKVLTVLEQGEVLVELASREKWMQIGVLETGAIAWIYKSLLQPHAAADAVPD